MALIEDNTDFFLKFASEDKWMRLAMAAADLIVPDKIEMRWGLNMSTLLERYVACYKNGGSILFVPLFSSYGDAGIFIYFEDVKPTDYTTLLKEKFGNRFWCEEICTDWPDNAKDIMDIYDDRALTIVNGKIASREV